MCSSVRGRAQRRAQGSRQVVSGLPVTGVRNMESEDGNRTNQLFLVVVGLVRLGVPLKDAKIPRR